MPFTKIKIAGAVAGSLLTIISLGTLVHNWYSNYSDQAKAKHEKELEIFVTEVFSKVSDNIITETTREIATTKKLLDSLQRVINQLQEGSEYFAVGFRGDGSGKLWYRDAFGKVFLVYFFENRYYYINENGLAVYI